MIVKAGPPVDAILEELVPHLEPGDIIIDGGNSHFPDTERRAERLTEKGLHFMGMGISGGEEGAGAALASCRAVRAPLTNCSNRS